MFLLYFNFQVNFGYAEEVGLDKAVLLTFYCSLIRSKWTYAAPSWFPNVSISDIKRLERTQKLCFWANISRKI